MIQQWDTDQIIRDLHRCAREINDHYNDGWTQWHCKQDLYRIKFELDQLLKISPHFSMEAEWLEEQQKQQVWKILNQQI